LRFNALDTEFREAVAAIDAGDLATLERLLSANPALVRQRRNSPREGFFRKPYLLWFVAEDPVRNGRLPANIAKIARAIIEGARRQGVDSLQEQLDYALRLVAWSGVAAECGVQNDLIDVLVDAGASIDGVADNALVNGHVGAAAHLIDRGASMTLATALCLGRWEDARRLAGVASVADRKDAMVLAALNGNAPALRILIDTGVDLDSPSANIYAHATPLHHAVCSGSLEAVKVIVEAGASLEIRDRAERATPRGWADYYVGEAGSEEKKQRYLQIAEYLREMELHPVR
jgi:ankyrin repeat protein